MNLSDMGQMALTSLKSLTVDKNRGNNDVKFSSVIQDNFIDSVELSDRAIQLSRQAEAEKAVEVKPAPGIINKGQAVVPAANPLQDVFAKALALNALA